jgi:hypothetical protein
MKRTFDKGREEPGVVAFTCTPSTWETENHKLKAIVGYTVRSYLKQNKN